MKYNLKYDKPLMENAITWSKESYCVKRKVGAVISEDSRPISAGYNGTDPGTCNDCEDEHGKTMHDKVTHAEANAIKFAHSRGIDLTGCTLYVTTAPCKQCAEKIKAAGIIRVVYLDIFKNWDGVLHLIEMGIPTTRFIKIDS